MLSRNSFGTPDSLTWRSLLALALLTSTLLDAGCGLMVQLGQPEAGTEREDAGAAEAGGSDTSAPDSTATDSATADGATVDASSAPPCGTVSLIRDDFDDGALSPDVWYYWSSGNTWVEEGNGRLEVHVQGSDWANVYSVLETSLIGDRITVQLGQPFSAATDGEVYLQFWSDVDNGLRLTQTGSILRVDQFASSGDSSWEFPFASGQQRWWSIREEGGRVYFETSPDGTSWVPLHDVAAPYYIMRGIVALGGGSQSGSASGVAAFDNLNLDRPTADWCPAADFSDDFNDGNSLRWRRSNSGDCTAAVGNQAMNMSALAPAECSTSTAHRYLLTGSSVVVELLGGAPVPDCGFAGLHLVNEEMDWMVRFGLSNGQLTVWESSSDLAYFIADQGFHWLRVSESAGELIFAAMGDSSVWVSLPPITPTTSFDPVVISLSLDAQDCHADQVISATWDNYNLGPP